MEKKFFMMLAVVLVALGFGIVPRANADGSDAPEPVPRQQPYQSYQYQTPPPPVYYVPPPPPVRVVLYPTVPFYGPAFGFGFHHYPYWSGRRVYHRFHHWR